MKTSILLFEQYQGRKEIGSSRIRGRWIVDNWLKSGQDIGECELFKQGQKYDAVVFQKVYWAEYARAFHGLKILDMCDPDWLHWSYRFTEALKEMDGVTCSTLEIARFLVKLTDKPVCVIPDRVDFATLPERKVHSGELKKVVWFGYSDNFPMLESAIQAIVKRGLELIVISDDVYVPRAADKGLNLTNLPFSEANYLTDIQKGDVVINPRFDEGKWKYKSENKTVLSWALGLPVAKTDKDLDSFASETDRRKVADELYATAKRDFDILQSVKELKEFIAELKEKC